jgi:DNA-binding winged helix-turn-helix (wHTH) protein
MNTPTPSPPLAEPDGAVQFGPFRFDARQGRLRRDGRDVPLQPKAFELLRFLLARPGRLLSKDELLDALWDQRFLTEGVLKSAVSLVRGALDDDPREPRWIATVPRRGYQFIGAVQCADAARSDGRNEA